MPFCILIALTVLSSTASGQLLIVESYQTGFIFNCSTSLFQQMNPHVHSYHCDGQVYAWLELHDTVTAVAVPDARYYTKELILIGDMDESDNFYPLLSNCYNSAVLRSNAHLTEGHGVSNAQKRGITYCGSHADDLLVRNIEGLAVGCLRRIGFSRPETVVVFVARAAGLQVPLRGRYLPTVTVGLLNVYLTCNQKWNTAVHLLKLFFEVIFGLIILSLTFDIMCVFWVLLRMHQLNAIMSSLGSFNGLLSLVNRLRGSECSAGVVQRSSAFNTPWLAQSKCADAQLSYKYDMYLCVDPTQKDGILIPIKNAIGSKRKILTDDDFNYGTSIINNLTEANQCCRWLVVVLPRRLADFPVSSHVINDILATRPSSLVPVVCKDYDDYKILRLLKPHEPLQWPDDGERNAFLDSLLARTEKPDMNKVNEDKGIILPHCYPFPTLLSTQVEI
jgi:hypothetical protein